MPFHIDTPDGSVGEEHEGSTVFAEAASLEFAKENPRRGGGLLGEVNVLRLKDRGIGGPATSVAHDR